MEKFPAIVSARVLGFLVAMATPEFPPSNALDHRAPGGQSPGTVAERSEACKALPPFALGFPEALLWIQHGRD